MLSPLETQRIWLEKLHVELSPRFSEGSEESYCIASEANVRKKRDALAFRVSLKLKLTPESGYRCRYKSVAVSVLGAFTLPEGTPTETVKQLVPLNCLAILHGFARGVVAQVTGLNDGGPFLLPTVNYVEALESAQTKKSSKTIKTACG